MKTIKEYIINKRINKFTDDTLHIVKAKDEKMSWAKAFYGAVIHSEDEWNNIYDNCISDEAKKPRLARTDGLIKKEKLIKKAKMFMYNAIVVPFILFGIESYEVFDLESHDILEEVDDISVEDFNCDYWEKMGWNK